MKFKKIIIPIFSFILFLSILCLATSCNSTQTTWTIMIYLCGSDLESSDTNGGWATYQLTKMLQSNFKDNVHVVVETGGASNWKNYNIANDHLQRYEISNHRLILKEDLITNEIGSPSTLTNFINYSVDTYPANHYGLIFFDHGFSWAGCEKDENNANKLLSPPEIAEGLKNAYASSLANQKFDFIHFDDCVMSNAETLCYIYPYTKLVIACERQGYFDVNYPLATGFNYAGLFELLSFNINIVYQNIGRYIVDQYALWQSTHTLKYAVASIDTKNFDVLNQKLDDFFFNYDSSNEDFWKMTGRRAQSFENGYNIIDLYNWMQFIPNSLEAKGVLDCLDNRINTYFKCSNDASYAHGINLYFPLTDDLDSSSDLYNEAPDYDAIYDGSTIFANTWSNVLQNWYYA